MKTADLILAAGDASADMRYATGFSTSDAYVWIRVDGKCMMLVSALEFDRARNERKKHVEVLRDTDFTSLPRPTFADTVLGAASRFGIGTFRVPSSFPLAIADRLRAGGLRLIAEEGAFFPEREWKNTDEVRLITEALRLAEKAVMHAREVIGSCSVADDGVLQYQGDVFTSEILRREIDLVLAAGGAMPTGTIAAAGIHGACPHDRGSGPIRAGEPIVMDVFPRMLKTGYWGDLTRTVVKGKPADVVQRAFDAVCKARDAAEKALGPGVIPGAVHHAAEASMAADGFATGRRDNGSYYGFFHGLGHGVGLEIHELPHLNPRGIKPLRGGEIITVEPGLYYPEWGGIRMEDMVYITADGAECLTEITSDFVIE
ncbi:MAG: aminopeptidase P family protein [Lentisphaeria bacterium]|nr:aminopeptidase P family protein [Lentisphaeria bacterium]